MQVSACFLFVEYDANFRYENISYVPCFEPATKKYSFKINRFLWKYL